jgi:uncharacterized membrane protein
MTAKTAITVDRSREEVQRRWAGDLRPAFLDDGDAEVTFKEAPGDRGTEIHVTLGASGVAARLPGAVQGVLGALPLAKVKDELRHFKALVETGEVPRSDGVPEGEQVERKFKQRPAQPLSDAELAKAGVR